MAITITTAVPARGAEVHTALSRPMKPKSVPEEVDLLGFRVAGDHSHAGDAAQKASNVAVKSPSA